jgi:hypothetical protein
VTNERNPGAILDGQNRYRLGPVLHNGRSIVQSAVQEAGPEADRRVIVKWANPHFAWSHGEIPEAGILQEMKVLSQLEPTPGVPRVVELVNGPRADDAALVLLPAEGEPLDHLWMRTREGLPGNWRVRIACLPRLARLLRSIHEKGWTQGDLTPHHVHFRDHEVSLLDFSHAARADSILTLYQGTPPWYVPELLGGTSPTRGDPRACEAFVFGLMLFHGLTGRDVYPQTIMDREELRATFLAGWLNRRADDQALPTDVSPALRDLLQRWVEPEPAKRSPIDDGSIAILDRELAQHRRRVFHSTSTLLTLDPGKPLRVRLAVFVRHDARLDGLRITASADGSGVLATVDGGFLRLAASDRVVARSGHVRLLAHEGDFMVDEHSIPIRIT